MQTSHRRWHARIWLIMALTLPVLFLLAYLNGDPRPLETQRPGAESVTQ